MVTTTFAYTMAAVLALPVFKEDVEAPEKIAQLVAVAHYVAQAEPPAGYPAKDWRALVLAVGFAESGLSLRIMRGDCKAHECDGGRARGGWQVHRNRLNAEQWDRMQGYESLEDQVAVASKMLARAYWQCSRKGHSIEALTASALSAYAGRGCYVPTAGNPEPWAGVHVRISYWRRARRAML